MNEPLAIATLAFLGITAYTSYCAFKSRKLIEKLLFSSVRIIQNKEYHRLISSGFIHADWPHLFFNMFSFYSFGSAIELTYGPLLLVLIYVSSILGGNLLSLILHRHEEYRALGASGGVCGVIFASIFLLPGGGVFIFPLPLAIPSWFYAILFILISVYGLRNQKGNIGHDAHLGGALCGLFVATIIFPEIITASPILYLAVVTISAIALVYTHRFPTGAQQSGLFSKPYWQNTGKKIQSRDKQRDQETLEQLLAKVSDGGLNSLSASEKKQLKAISKRMKKG